MAIFPVTHTPAPTVSPLVRKLFCTPAGLQGNLWGGGGGAASELLTKAILERERTTENASRRLERHTVISDTIPARLFPGASVRMKKSDLRRSRLPGRQRGATPDVTSRGTRHLFPLGPIIETSRLGIHKQARVQFRLQRRRPLMTSLPICRRLSNGGGKNV